MFYSYNGGPAIAMIPKNGTHSIRRALNHQGAEMTNEEALLLPIRVMVVRWPHDRLQSWYSHICAIRASGATIDPPIPMFTDYAGFLDWALDSNDGHVIPQVDHVTTKDGVFVPNRFHFLKDINNHWAGYYGPPGMFVDDDEFPRLNRSQHMSITEYRRADIERRYAKDYEVCKSV